MPTSASDIGSGVVPPPIVPPYFAWSSAAEEQLNERLGQLLGG